MTNYFQSKKMFYSKEEICQTLTPFWCEYFLPAIGGQEQPLMEAAHFKDMPRKKFITIERTISAMPDFEFKEDVDNMIIDDDDED